MPCGYIVPRGTTTPSRCARHPSKEGNKGLPGFHSPPWRGARRAGWSPLTFGHHVWCPYRRITIYRDLIGGFAGRVGVALYNVQHRVCRGGLWPSVVPMHVSGSHVRGRTTKGRPYKGQGQRDAEDSVPYTKPMPFARFRVSRVAKGQGQPPRPSGTPPRRGIKPGSLSFPSLEGWRA